MGFLSGLFGNEVRGNDMTLYWTGIALCFLLFLTLPAEGTTKPGCPEKCVCAPGAVVKCSKINTFPENIPKDTIKLTVSEFHFNDFPVQGLSPLKHLHTILFQNGHFEHLGACAFDNMVALEIFEIYNVSIQTLDKYAFTNTSNMTEISIHNSKIGVIRSRAFDNIASVKRIQLFQLNISRIESYAFNNIKTVGMFNFFMNVVKEMLPRALYKFGSNITLTISSNEFLKLGCQTVDYLIVRLGERVSFYDNSAFCGCQSAWMGRGEAREVLAEFLKETKCLGSPINGGSPKDYLLNVILPDFQEKCKDFDDGKCTEPVEIRQTKDEACSEMSRTVAPNTTAVTGGKGSASQVYFYPGTLLITIVHAIIKLQTMVS